MVLRGVIFDLDGTLVDSERVEWMAWNSWLKTRGHSFTFEEYAPFIGLAGSFLAVELFKQFRLSGTEKEAVLQKRSIAAKLLQTEPIPLMPFARESVEFFHEKKVKLAVSSNSRLEEVELKLKRTNLLPFFDFLSCKTDAISGKPSPALYRGALNGLNLESDDCIAFEDSQPGVESAVGAGIRCFAIPNDWTKHQDFSKAEFTFSNLKEAVDWVSNNFEL